MYHAGRVSILIDTRPFAEHDGTMFKWVLVPIMTLGLSLSSFCGSMAQAGTMHGTESAMMSMAERMHEPVPSCCIGKENPAHDSEALFFTATSPDPTPLAISQNALSVDRPAVHARGPGRSLVRHAKIKFASRSLVKRE